MTEQAVHVPHLMRARKQNTRRFAALSILALYVVQPAMEWEHPLRQAMLWLGYVMVVFAVCGRIYSSLYIGGRKGRELVCDGPFSVVRNPLYLCSFIGMVGASMQSGMVSLPLFLAMCFMLYYPHVVAKEEAHLQALFGESYERYMREVPRWLPKFGLWREPQELYCKPKFVHRTLRDALIFFLPFPGFMLVAKLQAADILPVWLTLF